VLIFWLSQEVHILHVYEHDFYGHEMTVVVLGYIRPELDYTSRGEWPSLQKTGLNEANNARIYRGSHRRY